MFAYSSSKRDCKFTLILSKQLCSHILSPFHTCTVILNISRHCSEEQYVRTSDSVGHDIKLTLLCQLPSSLFNVRLSPCVTRAGHCPQKSQQVSGHVDDFCGYSGSFQIHVLLISTQKKHDRWVQAPPLATGEFPVGENVSDMDSVLHFWGQLQAISGPDSPDKVWRLCMTADLESLLRIEFHSQPITNNISHGPNVGVC